MLARIQRRHSEASSDFQQNLLTSTVYDGAEDRISMTSTTKQASFFCLLRQVSFLQPHLCFVNSLPPPYGEYRKGTRHVVIVFFPS